MKEQITLLTLKKLNFNRMTNLKAVKDYNSSYISSDIEFQIYPVKKRYLTISAKGNSVVF